MTLPQSRDGSPYLQLAPMEGVGDRPFRKAMAWVGGFDEAVRDFLRVPTNAHVKSLAQAYEADELSPIPLAAQIMGSNPDLMASMARELASRGAPRIDINCGCPSNTVTGRGAGSSLLKDPGQLHRVACAVVQAVPIPVTIKMRSGYADTSLFEENLFAAQESNIRYLTLHPRTKAEGYASKARWDLIAKAKELLSIPIVGNGDIRTVEDALEMLKITGCDGLMIGRGALMNPFIFHQIRSHYSGSPYFPKPEGLIEFLRTYAGYLPLHKSAVDKLKQLLSFLFRKNEALLEMRPHILRYQGKDCHSLIEFAKKFLNAPFYTETELT